MSSSANCARCGEPFESKRKGHRFCSARCRVAANRERKQGESGAAGVLRVLPGGGEGGSGGSRPISTSELLLPAIAETLDHLEKDESDAAARQLARRYATTIDQARQVADALAQIPVTEDNAQLLYTLRARVEEQAVLEQLGPKLLAVLEQLGATPQARARMKGGGARGSSTSGGKLAGLRATRT